MRVYPLRLSLSAPWTVSHGTSHARTNVFLELDDGSRGEAPIVPYYPYGEAEVTDWLNRHAADLPADPAEPPDLALRRIHGGPPPAHSALDMALHDRWARSAGKPLHAMWNLHATILPDSSLTLSLPSDEASYVRSLEAMSGWPLLKLKLGSGDPERDLRLVHLVKKHFGGGLCIDANGGWDLETAVDIIPKLAEQEVAFVEEPLRDAPLDIWRQLRLRLPADSPPLLADESLQTAEDVVRLAPYIDGINVKLAKSGGIAGALALIALAREHGLKVLIGCMVESSLGVTAAAHLGPLADFLDLDGHLHLADDPFSGVIVERGRVILPNAPGLGVFPS